MTVTDFSRIPAKHTALAPLVYAVIAAACRKRQSAPRDRSIAEAIGIGEALVGEVISSLKRAGLVASELQGRCRRRFVVAGHWSDWTLVHHKEAGSRILGPTTTAANTYRGARYTDLPGFDGLGKPVMLGRPPNIPCTGASCLAETIVGTTGRHVAARRAA